MWEAILGFFSDLILFTAGLVVAAFWIVAIAVTCFEAIDSIIEYRNKNKKKESNDAEADLR